MVSGRPTHRAHQAPRSRRGVTLLDLVITVLIMGILSAVALPRFTTAVARLRTEAVARRIVSDLNYARRTAIQSSQATSVTFRASPAGYDFAGVTHPAHPAQSYRVNLTELDDNVALASFSFDGQPTLSFNAYGRPMVGATALTNGVVRVAYGGQSFDVLISAATGEAAVQ